MNEFMLLIRRDMKTKEGMPSPEQMQAAIKPFQDWIAGIAAQNKLIMQPKRWEAEGKVVHGNNIVTDGPYAEIKEGIGGMLLIKAENYDEAVEIAKGCPILHWGATVEVRMAIPNQ
jgi:hypothetical protein